MLNDVYVCMSTPLSLYSVCILDIHLEVGRPTHTSNNYSAIGIGGWGVEVLRHPQ